MSEKKTNSAEGPDRVIKAGEMQRLEAEAFGCGRLSSAEAMVLAGQGVADAVQRLPGLAEGAHEALVLCGPGNNGGDGYVVARLLHDRGWRVRVCAVGEPGPSAPDARHNRTLWLQRGPVAPLLDGVPADAAPEVIVDGLFGIGLTRGIVGDLAAELDAIALRWPVSVVPRVAVDLPSGLDTDTGTALGAVLAATVSVTFHRRKPVHLIRPDLCGRVEIVDIGL